MKIINQPFHKRYPKIIVGIAILSLVIFIMSFVAKDNDGTEANNNIEEITSVSIVDGKYKIDTNRAVANWNKEKLIATLETENLIEKKTVEEIPDFIKTFLNNISTNQTFDIANPDEEWREDSWINGFNNEQKTIVHATSSLAKPFPPRQLIYCGIGKNMALISYYIGGIKKTQSNMMIKFENDKIVNLWFDYYYSQFGYSLGGTTDFVTSKNDIIKYIRSTNSGGC